MKLLSTPAGQQLLQSANKLQSQMNAPALKPHTEEEIKRFYKLAEKDDVPYIRIDPTTQKPLREAKDFIWKITYAFPSMIGTTKVNESKMPTGDLRVQFQIQKYWRNKFVRRAKDPMSDPALPLADSDSVQSHEPWSERNGEGELLSPGDRHIDASDFEKQFQRDEEKE